MEEYEEIGKEKSTSNAPPVLRRIVEEGGKDENISSVWHSDA